MTYPIENNQVRWIENEGSEWENSFTMTFHDDHISILRIDSNGEHFETRYLSEPIDQITPRRITTGDYSVVVNGERLEFDQNPVMVNDRILVPVRGIFEALGAEVDFEQIEEKYNLFEAIFEQLGLEFDVENIVPLYEALYFEEIDIEFNIESYERNPLYIVEETTTITATINNMILTIDRLQNVLMNYYDFIDFISLNNPPYWRYTISIDGEYVLGDYWNNNPNEVPPLILNNRTLVPVRFIAEALGAEVDWDVETQTVIINTIL
jgi:hypothetical protein